MRAPSGPITGAVVLPGAKPRAPSGPLGAVAMPGVKPRAMSGPLAAMDLPPMAAGDPANANHLETGLLELGADNFASPMADGPALEVASLNPGPRREPPPQQREQPRREQTERRNSPRPPRADVSQDPLSAHEHRAKRARDLARYPAAPPKLMGAIPYFLRVYARRRELESQVGSLTQQRKRAEAGSDDALCLLGQALYVKRSDPQLKPLAAQVRVVGETAQDIGTRTAAARKTESGLQQDLATVERELSDARAKAEPIAAQEAALRQAVEVHEQQLKRRDMLIRKGDAEAKALKATNDPASLVRVSALAAEREQHATEIQALQRKLPPLEDELATVVATLEKQNAQVAAFEERKNKLHAQMGREQGRERVVIGGSQSAYRDALRSLANAATKLDLAGLCPAELKEAIETQQLAAASRESEEIMRAAIACYDANAYTRGMQLLVGSTIGLFVLFLALIVF